MGIPHNNEDLPQEGKLIQDTVPARAAALLREGLEPLLRSGHLKEVRTNCEDAYLSRLLLTVSPGRPDLYVGRFQDEELSSDQDPEEGEPLIGLMNWVGSEEEPTVWEMGAAEPKDELAERGSPVRRLIEAE